MPLHGHQHSSNESQANHPRPHDTLSGMLQAAQTLGAVGAPPGSLHLAAASGTTPATPDGLHAFNKSINRNSHCSAGLNGSIYTAATRRNSDIAASAPQRLSTMANSTRQSFDTTRRPAAFGRQPEELHIPPSANSVSSSNHSRPQHHQQASTGLEHGTNNPPSISIQQSTHQHSQYGPISSSALPGALQPGNTNRPATFSANTAPSAIPILPQISTQSQQSATPRLITVNNSQGHSRSSPSAFDQSKYKQYEPTTENPKYTSPPSSGYPHTPQGAKYSPLGLADIRPHTDSVLIDTPIAPGSHLFNGEFQTPNNSNYVAPWPIYAVDWCKWPISAPGPFAGKIAIGGYLEDSHNYVYNLPVRVFGAPGS
jgi:hypothetical protein